MPIEAWWICTSPVQSGDHTSTCMHLQLVNPGDVMSRIPGSGGRPDQRYDHPETVSTSSPS